MKFCQVCIVAVVALLLLAQSSEARKRKHKDSSHEKTQPRKTKTKTKWSTSSETAGESNAQVATEEHGYYVKRTYSPNMAAGKQQSPPYLAIPIAWFSCKQEAGCQQSSNSGAINGAALALSEGYLCDDDCVEPYEPICGKTPTEVAVFYNQCKLNVAKCRTHGLWEDLPYEQCKQLYPKETAYTERKFKSSPYFRAANSSSPSDPAEPAKPSDVAEASKSSESSEEKESDALLPGIAVAERIALPPAPTKQTLVAAMSTAFDEISEKLTEAEKVVAAADAASKPADNERLKYQTN